MSVVDRLKDAAAWIERRQHARTGSPLLKLKFDGEKYKALDWSLGGCRIRVPGHGFQLTQRIAGRVWLDGADNRGEFVAEVVRLEADGEVALRWLELSPHIFVAMGQ